MPRTPDAKVSIVFTTERMFDDKEVTTLNSPSDDGRGLVTVMRFTANVRHEGGEYDGEGNPRSFWLRFVAAPHEMPYLVTHWMSRKEMRAHLEDLWGGWWVNADGCDVFSPDFMGDSLRLPEPCGECNDTGWFPGTGYGHTDPPGPGQIVQRCDECSRFDGDLAAAIDWARVNGGQVHAIIGSTIDGEPQMAPQSDAWVFTGGTWDPLVHGDPGTDIGGVIWHTEIAATYQGWYENPEAESADEMYGDIVVHVEKEEDH